MEDDRFKHGREQAAQSYKNRTIQNAVMLLSPRRGDNATVPKETVFVNSSCKLVHRGSNERFGDKDDEQNLPSVVFFSFVISRRRK